ncbi:hypothetical protein ESCNG_290018 [Neisseria gonorrhoeae]|nr:hypothetical protein ESCNG_290018 [Neisseria gonorrhoeae]SCW19718.1 hypothetical protein ESCNG_650001 [Neisseria gonorrhoeae]
MRFDVLDSHFRGNDDSDIPNSKPPVGIIVLSPRGRELERGQQAVLVCINLNPNSHPVLSPCGRELERGQQAARFVF